MNGQSPDKYELDNVSDMILRIVHVSIQSVDASRFRKPAEDVCSQRGYQLDLFCANDRDIDSDPLLYHEMAERSKNADLVLVRVMADPTRMRRFEQWEKVLQQCSGYVYVYSGNMDASLAYRHLFKGDDTEYIRLREYIRGKGEENDAAVVMWLIRMLTGEGELPDPVTQRADGIYHPDFDRDVSESEYVSHLDPTKPTVGILFTSNLWLYGNLEHIDALIRDLESRGLNTIPVFYLAVSARSMDAKGTAAIVKEYFMKDGASIVDSVIVCSPFSQLNNSRDTDGVETPEDRNFFRTMLNVPVFQVMSVSSHYPDYEEADAGGGTADLNANLIWSEVDGQIIAVPVASNEQPRGAPKFYTPLRERISHISSLVERWCRLRRKPAAERRIAILVYQSRPESGRIGGAAGLDTIESVKDMLSRFRDEGYTVERVPETSKELVEWMLDNITNDLEWSSDERIKEMAADMMTLDEYLPEYGKMSQFNRLRTEENWGKPPGNVAVIDGEIVIPGIIDGNIFIGYQPLRSWADQMEAVYHSPVVPMPHQYLAFYRWLKYDFGVDAIIHVGTHGTLEWLPGRANGLSGKCFPDICLDSVPHVYPYVIDDPGEGIQAKRRSEAVLIGHMCPVMARAGGYEELESVNGPLQELFKNRTARGEQRKAMVREILDACRRTDILEDLNISDIGEEEFENELGRLHDYITSLKDAIIRDGLHVFGRAPEGELLREAVYSMTRTRNGDVPALRHAIAVSHGYDMDALLDNPSDFTEGEMNSVIAERMDGEAVQLIADMSDANFDIRECGRLSDDDGVREVIAFVCNSVVPNLLRTREEMDNTMRACNGEYVLPGPSGAPTRGGAHILPTGRNFYGIDPDIVPTKAAWEIGKRMADQMISKYIDAKGCYPTEVGFIIWATDTMKNNGDDVAYILWLMGARPVWSGSGKVTGVEAVPLDELGRPRIDVTVRITGLFRDTFPNLITLIDDAVKTVSALDEKDEDNILAANLRRDIAEAMISGLTVDEARRRASVRVFGCPPGAYGPGVNHAIESGDWKTVQDLADIYTAWGSCAYGRNEHGETMKDEFVKRFSKVKATVKNMPDREIDLLDIDDVYGYLGGMNSFVRAYGEGEALSFMGDSSDPDRVRTRDTAEELRFVYRSKILNPKFVDGLKRHGYRGVAEIAKFTEFTFGWDATSGIVDDWMYEKLAEKYLLDDETGEWMKDENPYAVAEMLDRLFEAVDRGFWDIDPEMLEKLRNLYIAVEERVEEIQDRNRCPNVPE